MVTADVSVEAVLVVLAGPGEVVSQQSLSRCAMANGAVSGDAAAVGCLEMQGSWASSVSLAVEVEGSMCSVR